MSRLLNFRRDLFTLLFGVVVALLPVLSYFFNAKFLFFSCIYTYYTFFPTTLSERLPFALWRPLSSVNELFIAFRISLFVITSRRHSLRRVQLLTVMAFRKHRRPLLRPKNGVSRFFFLLRTGLSTRVDQQTLRPNRDQTEIIGRVRTVSGTFVLSVTAQLVTAGYFLPFKWAKFTFWISNLCITGFQSVFAQG